MHLGGHVLSELGLQRTSHISAGVMAVRCLRSCGMCLPVLPKTQLDALAGRSPGHGSSTNAIGDEETDLNKTQPLRKAVVEVNPRNITAGAEKQTLQCSSNVLLASAFLRCDVVLDFAIRGMQSGLFRN